MGYHHWSTRPDLSRTYRLCMGRDMVARWQAHCIWLLGYNGANLGCDYRTASLHLSRPCQYHRCPGLVARWTAYRFCGQPIAGVAGELASPNVLVITQKSPRRRESGLLDEGARQILRCAQDDKTLAVI